MGDEQYVEPSRKAQIALLVFLLLAALSLVLVEAAISQRPNTGTNILFGVSVIGFIVALFWVTYFARLGYRAITMRHFPPPGTIVVRRTKVRTGRTATLAGYSALACSGLMSAFAVLVAYAACLSFVAP